MTIITDPYFYMLAIPGVLLYGMAKGGLGTGLGAIAVPVLSFVINPVKAAAIMLPILCVMDLFAIWKFKKRYELKHLKILLPAGIIGIIISSLVMGELRPETLKLVIGIIAATFCVNYWIRNRVKNDNLKRKIPGKLSGYFWGIVTGFTSMQIHAGGPPVSIYLFPQRMDKIILMGTMAVFFTVMNYIKLIPYAILGQLDYSNLMTSLVLMPVAPVGVLVGYFFLNKINQNTLYRYLYFFLFVSGCKLIYDGLF